MPAQRVIVLARVPHGVPAEDDFRLEPAEIPEPGPGQVLGRVLYLSLDPYLRSAIAGRHMSRKGGVAPGEVVPGRSIVQVVRSAHAAFAPGDYALAETGWCEYAVVEGAAARKLDPTLAPLSTFLGVLGMPGLTAWAGVTDLLRPRSGETFVVSAAAGPVGATAGQIARIAGCRVVGIAGSDAKCAHVMDAFGFDACVNYKKDAWREALARACPDGIDMYFDNVGGEILEAVIAGLRMRGRIALCGLIGQYNTGVPYALPLAPVIGKRARLMGLVVYDYEARTDEFTQAASRWLADGRLKWLEDRADGLPAAPAAFRRLMSGENFGKSIVVVSREKETP